MTQTPPAYFDRVDVKAAIHAPADVDWVVCAHKVFTKSDASLPPAFTVLQDVIEKGKCSVIVQVSVTSPSLLRALAPFSKSGCHAACVHEYLG